ncbi:MAG: response regulator [Pirellulaceae bacterium]|jgi:response regulator NasT|nr:response regulator [Pirellulaceae bacterium]
MSGELRIAVADDESEMRDFFEKVLPRFGHQVVAVAENGAELVEHCRRVQPDLVITDIKMPELDGIEASCQICRDRPIPVILVSAYHDPALIARAEADHVQAYLVKPIGLADLQPAISIAVRRFAELQALQIECKDLRQALADRKLIEQAKGLLMKLTGIDETEAFRRLQDLAAERNQKLIDAAKSILAVEKALAPRK